MRGTLEERVMSLQRWKLDVAAAVVNVENASMAAMDTGNLLELFTLEEGGGAGGGAAGGAGGSGGAGGGAAGAAPGGKGGLAALLEEAGDAEAVEAQYGEEFDLEAFKRRMLGKRG
jgi:TATA-binding protein-associated factor